MRIMRTDDPPIEQVLRQNGKGQRTECYGTPVESLHAADVKTSP